jgi:pantoate--beta-alanine ligase
MEIVRRARPMKEIVRSVRAKGRRVGLVPTLGYLHDGHLSLLRRVKEISDIVVVSVFVNPAQFGPDEDFDAYPRDLARDADLCIAENVDYLFTPDADEIYPDGSSTFVEVQGLSDILEGATRPGHFRGVATVVLKLLEIVKPHAAAFGQKDLQQLVVVQRMVRDLSLDVEILAVPTVRDEDGVALSSRNAYLREEERIAARAIPGVLQMATRRVADGEWDAAGMVRAAREILESEPLVEIDYVELVEPATLQPLDEIAAEAYLLIAVRIGKTRLIDNILLRRAAP